MMINKCKAVYLYRNRQYCVGVKDYSNCTVHLINGGIEMKNLPPFNSILVLQVTCMHLCA